MMMRSRFAAAAALLVVAASARAQGPQDGSCVYNREVYPEGTEMCQNDDLVRCEDGVWSDVGDCPSQPMPSPNPGGGDVEGED